MKNWPVWMTAVMLAATMGGKPSAATDPFSTIATEPFATIAKRGIAATKLDQAMARLPTPPREPPWFWSSIANESDYSQYHRRRAVFQLFRRHIHAGMRLSELGSLLSHPTWLRAKDIDPVVWVGGWIPVLFDPRDSIFVPAVLPEVGKDQASAYLRIQGDIDTESFRSCLLGTANVSPAIGRTVIAEIGLCEDPRERPCERSRVWRNGLSEYRPAPNDGRPDD